MNQELEFLVTRMRSVIGNVAALEAVDSTHAMAVRLIEQMDEEGLELQPTVLLSGAQDAGLGRGGRSWQSPTGGLYLNWLGCGLETEQIQALPMIAAAAVHQALETCGIEGPSIKWPNDILIDGHKVAGILVHARHGETLWATIGIGINVTISPAINDPGALPATSVAEHLEIDEPAVVAADLGTAVVTGLSEGMSDPGPALDRWRSSLVHHPGDQLRVRLANAEVVDGIYAGLTDLGFLELDTADGRRVITGGDVVEQS